VGFIYSYIAFILALFSKETAIFFPLALILHDYLFTPLEKAACILKMRFKPLLVFFFISFFYISFRIFFFHGSMERLQFLWGRPPYRMFITIPAAIVDYIRVLFLPINLTLSDVFPLYRSFWQPNVLFSFFLLGVLFFLVWKCRKSFKELMFSVIWFFIFLMPFLVQVYQLYFPKTLSFPLGRSMMWHLSLLSSN
jgi:hypothetical protein